jgi:hypothetical protein
MDANLAEVLSTLSTHPRLFYPIAEDHPSGNTGWLSPCGKYFMEVRPSG